MGLELKSYRSLNATSISTGLHHFYSAYDVDDLLKTRSGKIMRRILRKLAAGEGDSLGDVSTLLNPECVADIRRRMES